MCRRTKEYTENRNSLKGHMIAGSGRRLPGGGDTKVLQEEQEPSSLSGVGIGNRQGSEVWETLLAHPALPLLPRVTETLRLGRVGN